jgi:hypothetical protein
MAIVSPKGLLCLPASLTKPERCERAESSGGEFAERLIGHHGALADNIAHRLVTQGLDNPIVADAAKELALGDVTEQLVDPGLQGRSGSALDGLEVLRILAAALIRLAAAPIGPASRWCRRPRSAHMCVGPERRAVRPEFRGQWASAQDNSACRFAPPTQGSQTNAPKCASRSWRNHRRRDLNLTDATLP